MTAYAGVIAALDDHDAWPGEPGKGNAYCPHHEGDGKAHRPSLAVGVRRDGDGALVYCRAGCVTADVLAALGLPVAALFDSWPGWRR
jgi:hypothetical protein